MYKEFVLNSQLRRSATYRVVELPHERLELHLAAAPLAATVFALGALSRRLKDGASLVVRRQQDVVHAERHHLVLQHTAATDTCTASMYIHATPMFRKSMA